MWEVTAEGWRQIAIIEALFILAILAAGAHEAWTTERRVGKRGVYPAACLAFYGLLALSVCWSQDGRLLIVAGATLIVAALFLPRVPWWR